MGFLLNKSDEVYDPVSPAGANVNVTSFENDPACQDNATSLNVTQRHVDPPVSRDTTIGLSILYSSITAVGLVGNFLVIYVILTDRKMRRSVTNLFIMNLAVADFLIMLFGIPRYHTVRYGTRMAVGRGNVQVSTLRHGLLGVRLHYEFGGRVH